ncbi:MAG: hypothetical protein QOG18_902, partial [Microbacteriaceae bacterium]|nr:hypothetical protein [Microbacteriaceae bacterium]
MAVQLSRRGSDLPRCGQSFGGGAHRVYTVGVPRAADNQMSDAGRIQLIHEARPLNLARA